MAVNENCKPDKDTVTSKACSYTTVCSTEVSVPISVTPYAKIGHVTSKCTGKPRVKTGDVYAEGTVNGSCSFVISQLIRVDIPVEFGTKTSVGENHVKCFSALPDDEPCHEEYEEPAPAQEDFEELEDEDDKFDYDSL